MNTTLSSTTMAAVAASLRAYQARRRARPPSQEKSPGAGQAIGARIESTKCIDYRSVMSLAGLKFPAAAREAARHSAELFPAGMPRFLARALLSRNKPSTLGLMGWEERELAALVDLVERAEVPDTEEWAIRLIQMLAEDRYEPLLIDSLQWAQDRVRDRWPLPRIEREVVRAFRIARGDLPLDPADRWECAA